jgi:4-amino-4-deoxy-L-arabinose transferase-like glycosyltransferase
MSEPLFIPLMLGALLAALQCKVEPGRMRWAIMTGVLGGLAALTRGNGFLVALALAATVWGRPWRSWRSARAPAIIAAVTALVVAPWVIRDALVLHAFVPVTTETGYELIGTYNSNAANDRRYPADFRSPGVVPEANRVMTGLPRLSEAQTSSKLTSMALDYIDAHPAYVLKVVFWDTIRLLDLAGRDESHIADASIGIGPRFSDLGLFSFWLVGLLALGSLLTRQARRVPAAVWLSCAVIVVTTVTSIGNSRYRRPLEPVFVVLAALALTRLWELARGREGSVAGIRLGRAAQ